MFSFEWHKLTKEFSQHDRVKFMRVDVNTIENEPLLERYGVTGVPALKVFSGSRYEMTLTGERTADALIAALNAELSQGASKRRNADGTYNIGSNAARLVANLDEMCVRVVASGRLTEPAAQKGGRREHAGWRSSACRKRKAGGRGGVGLRGAFGKRSTSLLFISCLLD